MDKMPYILALGVVTVLLLLQNLGVLPLLGGDGGVVDGLALALAGAGFLAGLLTAGRLYPPPPPPLPEDNFTRDDCGGSVPEAAANEGPVDDEEHKPTAAKPLLHVTPAVFESPAEPRPEPPQTEVKPMNPQPDMPLQPVNENHPSPPRPGRDIPVEDFGQGVVNALDAGIEVGAGLVQDFGQGVVNALDAGIEVGAGLVQDFALGADSVARTAKGGVTAYYDLIQRITR